MAEFKNFDMPNWDKVSLPVAQLFFAESEKRLQASIGNYQRNKDIAHRLLALVLPIVIVTGGYAIGSVGQSVTWPALFFMMAELVGVFLLVRSIRSQPVMYAGDQPKNLWEQAMIVTDAADLQQIGILLNLSEKIQYKLDVNLKAVDIVAKRVNQAIIWCGLVAPIAFLLTFLIFRPA